MVFYQIAFWLPGIVAVTGFILAWNAGILRRPLIPLSVLAVGLLLQTIGAVFSPAWAAGLVSQVALAVYLLVRLKIDA
jgi:hypothetical protein